MSWVRDVIDFLDIIIKVLAELVTQVRICVLIAFHSYGILASDATVVGGEDDVIVALSQSTEQVTYRGMTEPAQRDASVGGFVRG